MARGLHTGPGTPLHAQSVHIQFSGGLRGQGGNCYKRALSRMGWGISSWSSWLHHQVKVQRQPQVRLRNDSTAAGLSY